MPTIVKGAPVASRIPPHENRAKLRVAPDEDPAEFCSAASSLMRIRQSRSAASPQTRIRQSHSARRSRRKSVKVTLHVAPDKNRGSVAPMQRAIRETGNPPTHSQNHTAKRAYRQERYTGNDAYGFSAQISSPWADNQSPSGKNAHEKQTAESKRLRSRKKQRFIFLFYHTKVGKATGRNANMQFVYTAGQAEKQSTVAWLHILHLLPLQLKILRQKSC